LAYAHIKLKTKVDHLIIVCRISCSAAITLIKTWHQPFLFTNGALTQKGYSFIKSIRSHKVSFWSIYKLNTGTNFVPEQIFVNHTNRRASLQNCTKLRPSVWWRGKWGQRYPHRARGRGVGSLTLSGGSCTAHRGRSRWPQVGSAGHTPVTNRFGWQTLRLQLQCLLMWLSCASKLKMYAHLQRILSAQSSPAPSWASPQ